MTRRLPTWLVILLLYSGLLVLGVLDWLTGYELNFSVFYFVPVSLAAWLLGPTHTLAVTVLSALTWSSADLLSGHAYSSPVYPVWNSMTRLAAFLTVGLIVLRLKEMVEGEKRTSDALRRALSEVKVLEAFLPVCCRCKKIRDEKGDWQQMELYIGRHSNTQFSHGYCPDCARKTLEEAGITDKPR